MKEFDENKIDDFLLGRMDENELNDFKKKVSMDKSFAEQVNKRKAAIKYIDVLGDLAMKKRIQDLHQDAVNTLPPERPFKVLTLLKYAAAIFFIIAAGYWFLQGPATSQDIYNRHYQAYELSFEERGNDSQDAISTGGRFYSDGKYQQALDQFNTLPPEAVTAKITLAKGISYLETDQHQDAAKAFRALIDNRDPIYEEHARWYLAMTYFKQGDKDAAIAFIRQIAEQKGSYNQLRALEILEKTKD